MSEPHPSLDELAAFDGGQLEAAALAAIERHVADCDACCRQLETVRDDAFVQLVRRSAGKPDSDTRVGVGDTWSAGFSWSGPEVPPDLAGHPRYRILGFLGAGGMGMVFKAEHRLMERIVALKILNPELVNRPHLIERFRQEVKAAARLDHANIVRALDADQAGDCHFLIMEYVEGLSLDRGVAEKGPLPALLACGYVRQAALGLQHASDQGMVHRDIKPGNLLVTPAQQVKVLDFGLARFVSERTLGSALTNPGMLIGTPDFMAPEQALDPSHADCRADIYSLGCTLYYLLSGQPPFPHASTLRKLMAHQERQPTPIAQLRPDVPPALAGILERMLAKDPRQRYQSAQAVAEALAPFAQPDSPRPLATPRRKLGIVLGLFGLLLVGGIVAAVRGPKKESSPSVAARPASPPSASSPVPSVELAPDELRRVSAQPPFTAAAFSGDGRRALVAGPEFALHWVDLESGKMLARFPGHTAEVLAIALALDGRHAISGGKDQTVRLWDLAGGGLLHTFTAAHAGWVRGVSMLADGRRAISVGNDGLLVLWDLQERAVKGRFTADPSMVRAVTLTSQGYALTGGGDRSLHMWDLAQDKPSPLRTFRGHQDIVRAATTSANQRYLLSGGDDGVARFWRMTPEESLQELKGHAGPVTAVAFNPDGFWALTGGSDRTVRLWNLVSGQETLRLEGHTDEVIQVAWVDGKALSASRDGTIRTWKLPKVDVDLPRFRGASTAILSVALTADKRILASSGGDGVRLWDVKSRQLITLLKGHQGACRQVVMSDDGRIIATAGDDKTVRLWDATTHEARLVLTDHTDQVPALALTPDGRTLVSGSWDHTVKVWDLADWKPDQGKPPVTTLNVADAVTAVAISADGSQIAIGLRSLADEKPIAGDIRVHHRGTGQERTIKGHSGPVLALDFSPDGKRLAAIGGDRTVWLWEVASGRKLQWVTAAEGVSLSAVSFHPNGRWLAVAGSDRRVRLLSAPENQPSPKLDIINFNGHLEGVTALKFSRDGLSLASGSEDTTALLWDMSGVK